MNEDDYALIAMTNGWMKFKRGWYHPFALSYLGWGNEYRCFKSAEQAIQYQLASKEAA